MEVVAVENLESTPAGSPHRGHVIARGVRLPLLAVRVIAYEVSRAARRPDAVAYWAGLAGLAAVGVLDWPVAAAIGVGVAVASGVRGPRG